MTGVSDTCTGRPRRRHGMFAIQVSVRQLQGRADAQVESPEIAVVLGAGGMFASAAALVLGRT